MTIDLRNEMETLARIQAVAADAYPDFALNVEVGQTRAVVRNLSTDRQLVLVRAHPRALYGLEAALGTLAGGEVDVAETRRQVVALNARIQAVLDCCNARQDADGMVSVKLVRALLGDLT